MEEKEKKNKIEKLTREMNPFCIVFPLTRNNNLTLGISKDKEHLGWIHLDKNELHSLNKCYDLFEQLKESYEESLPEYGIWKVVNRYPMNFSEK